MKQRVYETNRLLSAGFIKCLGAVTLVQLLFVVFAPTEISAQSRNVTFTQGDATVKQVLDAIKQ
ncbi:MAG: hypothetical protein LUE10_07650 [Alistipes sp.]|nr:hypothetical protein [Alistipes sp.]